jgi:beta-phosphoglucomutase-like phosphatase (HAD superfamily)
MPRPSTASATPRTTSWSSSSSATGSRSTTARSSTSRPPARPWTSAGIIDLFDEIIDGTVADERKLRGKPHPDTYLAGAQALGVEPSASAVFEDATSGVQAGHDGHFGYVVGVDRVDHAADLERHGADIVVKDLSELLAK